MSSLLGLPDFRKDIKLSILVSISVFIFSILSQLTSPDYTYVSLDFFCFFLSSLLAFYIFFFLLGMRVSFWKRFKVSSNGFIFLCLALGMVALTSKLLDRFYLRPPVDYFSIASYRQARDSGSNIFSVLSSIIFPLLLMMYGKAAELKIIRRPHFLFFALAFLLFFFDILMSGSRGILLVCVVALFFNKLNRRNLVFYVPALFLASGLFFLVRFASLMDIDDVSGVLAKLSTAGYSFFVPASDFALELMQDYQGSGIDLVLFSLVQGIQYFSHGFFEFAYIYATHPDFQLDITALLPQLSKIQESSYVLERAGAYYTLPGTLYLSFGVLSIFASALCGVFLGLLYVRSATVSRNARGIVILSVFLVPFVNGIGGFDLIFFLLAIYLVSMIKVVRVD